MVASFALKCGLDYCLRNKSGAVERISQSNMGDRLKFVLISDLGSRPTLVFTVPGFLGGSVTISHVALGYIDISSRPRFVLIYFIFVYHSYERSFKFLGGLQPGRLLIDLSWSRFLPFNSLVRLGSRTPLAAAFLEKIARVGGTQLGFDLGHRSLSFERGRND